MTLVHVQHTPASGFALPSAVVFWTQRSDLCFCRNKFSYSSETPSPLQQKYGATVCLSNIPGNDMHIDTSVAHIDWIRVIVKYLERKAISEESPLLHSSSYPIWSWKVSIPRRPCRLFTDLLSSGSMLWICGYDVWGHVRGVRRGLRHAADTGDKAVPVSWALQSTGSTCQDIKMDGGDLLCVQRIGHNLAQMLSDSCPFDGLVSWQFEYFTQIHSL